MKKENRNEKAKTLSIAANHMCDTQSTSPPPLHVSLCPGVCARVCDGSYIVTGRERKKKGGKRKEENRIDKNGEREVKTGGCC